MEGYTGEEFKLIKTVLYTEAEIQAKCDELAKRINEDYKDKEVIVVCILRGAAMFMVDICKRLRISNIQEFIALSSYGDGTESTGNVKTELDFKHDVKGKHLLIVEDIIDSGNCLSRFLKDLKLKEVASVEICVLLDKIKRRQIPVNCKYIGWVMEEEPWVVGYGMDSHGGKFRSLSFIAAL